jgi:hypothetical protein
MKAHERTTDPVGDIALVHFSFGPAPLRIFSQNTNLTHVDSSACSLESVMDHLYERRFQLVERRHFMGDPSIHGRLHVVFYAQGIPRSRNAVNKREPFRDSLFYILRALVGEPWITSIATEPFMQHGKPTSRTILRIHLMLPPPITAADAPDFRRAETRLSSVA